MVIDERARLSLYQRLEEVLGSEHADTMMAHLPPSGWGDVATKADLALMSSALRADLDRGVAQARTELTTQIGDLRVEMITGFADVRNEMTTGFADVRNEMTTGLAGIGELRTEMYRSQRQLALTLVGVISALNSALVAVIVALR